MGERLYNIQDIELLQKKGDLANDAGSLAINVLRRSPTGVARDITKLVITLSNAQAKQRAEIAQLQRELEGKADVLRSKQEEQAAIQSQIERTVGLLRDKSCFS